MHFERKNVNIFLSISLNISFGCSEYVFVDKKVDSELRILSIDLVFACSQAMFKSISKQNLIKIYHVVQELSAFSLTDHDWPD